MAAALADFPRLLEFANAVMPKNISEELALEVFEKVRTKLEERYDPWLPEAAVLYPAIFGDETERDDRVMSLIKRSIFVNSVKNVMIDQKMSISITPSVSLFMLSAAAKGKAERDRFAGLVAEFLDGMLNDEGRPLEWCAYWWLQMRLATAAGKENFSLGKLFGLEEVTFDGFDFSMLKKLKEVKFTVPAAFSDVYTTLRGRKLSNSGNGRAQFFEDMGSLSLGFERVVWLLEAPHGEAWDAMLAVFDTQANQWFVVFLELKARRNLEDRNQARHVQELVEELRQKPDSSAGLLQVLKDGRYCYLYITTAEGESETGQLAIVLKENDTTRFFGPLAAVHKAIRRAFQGP